MSNVICSYCEQPAEWVSNETIYGRRYGASYMIWLCRSCEAWVGCHQNTKRPLGTLANKELRTARMKAHDHIDPLWRSGKFPRKEVYRALAEHFGKEIHIGGADMETCNKILQIALPAGVS